MPNAAGNRPVLIFAGEFLRIRTRLWMRRSVGITLKSNRGYRDYRTRGQPRFQLVIFRLTFSQTKAPSVIVDHDGNVVRILKGSCAATERGMIEIPLVLLDFE